MGFKATLEDLINQGYVIKEQNTHVTGIGEYISGEEYQHWIQGASLFLKNKYGDHFQVDNFIQAGRKAVGNGIEHFDTMIGILKAFAEADSEPSTVGAIAAMAQKNFDKIFVSHAHADSEYVKLFVHLLNSIGIKKDRDSIFCSSLPGYNIPEGQRIYEYIKTQLNESILVVFILSENYYDSAACLNEMGAAWIASKDYTSILLPLYSFSKKIGAIDPTVISFSMDDTPRLNDFRKKLINLFDLDNYDSNIWDEQRDKFLSDLDELIRQDSYRQSLQSVEVENIRPVSEFQMEIALRFKNKSITPSQCTELKVTLTDADNESLSLQLSSDFLDRLIVYGNENRRETHIVELKDLTVDKFNLRRWKSGFTTSYWRPYF